MPAAMAVYTDISDEELAEEISQLLYWSQVMMIKRGLTTDDVYKYL